MTLEDWIKTVAKISYEDFGERIGTTGEAIRRYCSGKRMPEPQTAQKIIDETKGAVTAQDLLNTRNAVLSQSGEPGPENSE